VALAACLLAVGTAIAVVACIADLPPDVSLRSDAGGSASFCGDGYIDIEAGEQCDPGLGAGPSTVTECSPSCRVQCPAGHVGSGSNYCYELVGNTVSLDQARMRCDMLSREAKVVTFASEAEFSEVARWVHDIEAGPLWVGLQQGPVSHFPIPEFEPGWAPTCSGCYAHTSEAGARLPLFIDAGADGGPPPTQACVVAFSDTSAYPSWFQVACGQGAARVHAVCKRKPIGMHSKACEAGICIELVQTHATKRYVFQSSPVTADEAKRQCEVLGGKLAVLESREEREQLWHELSVLMLPPARLWIGLAQSAGEAGAGDAGVSTWVWDDGTPAEGPDAYASPWGDGQPTDAGSSPRAYLSYDPLALDNTLARNVGRMPSPFVCQLPVGGP
jgi:hypothetical protein